MKYIKSLAFLLTQKQKKKKSFLDYKMKAFQGRCHFRFAFTRLSCFTCFFCARCMGIINETHMGIWTQIVAVLVPVHHHHHHPGVTTVSLFKQWVFGVCGWGLIIVLWASHPGCDPHLFSLWGKWTSDLCHLTLLLRAERGSLASKVPTEHSR